MSRDDDCDSLDGLIEDLMVGEETVDSCGVNSNIDTCQAKRERSSSDDILDAAIEEIEVEEEDVHRNNTAAKICLQIDTFPEEVLRRWTSFISIDKALPSTMSCDYGVYKAW